MHALMMSSSVQVFHLFSSTGVTGHHPGKTSCYPFHAFLIVSGLKRRQGLIVLKNRRRGGGGGHAPASIAPDRHLKFIISAHRTYKLFGIVQLNEVHYFLLILAPQFISAFRACKFCICVENGVHGITSFPMNISRVAFAAGLFSAFFLPHLYIWLLPHLGHTGFMADAGTLNTFPQSQHS